MKRREFLKIGGAAALLALLPLEWVNSMQITPPEVQFGDLIYRGTADGKIYRSSDQGKTWDLHTNLGPNYAVHDMLLDRLGDLYIQVGFQRHSFYLRLSDDQRRWKTVA